MTTQYGPIPAPNDYRIANRPDNPNWKGVAAWFDESLCMVGEHDWSDESEHGRVGDSHECAYCIRCGANYCEWERKEKE